MTMLSTALGPLPVTPGLLDMNAEVGLRSGACIDFALALNRATGLPMVAAFEHGLWADTDAGIAAMTHQHDIGFVHALVLLPDGRVLDSSGPSDAWAYRSEWRADRPHDLHSASGAQLERLGTLCSDNPAGLIDSFVPPLLARHHITARASTHA